MIGDAGFAHPEKWDKQLHEIHCTKKEKEKMNFEDTKIFSSSRR